jgi:hypothetical protein
MLALGPPAQPVARTCRTALLEAYADGTGTTNVMLHRIPNADRRGMRLASRATPTKAEDDPCRPSPNHSINLSAS